MTSNSIVSNSLAVVVAIFSLNEIRKKLLFDALANWQKQTADHTISIAHLLFDTEEALDLSAFPQVNYRVIKASAQNADLWQKEHLFNILFAQDEVDDSHYCYFLDADISLSWVNGHKQGMLLNQNCGLAWGMTALTMAQVGGFKPLPDGSGDSAWVMEVSGKRFGELIHCSWFTDRLRSLSVKQLDCFDLMVSRLGNFSNDYFNRTRLWSYLALPWTEYFDQSPNQLLTLTSMGEHVVDVYHNGSIVGLVNEQKVILPRVIPRLYGDVFEYDFFDFIGQGAAWVDYSDNGFALKLQVYKRGDPLKQVTYHLPITSSILQRLHQKTKVQLSCNMPVSIESFTAGASYFELSRQRYKLAPDIPIEITWLAKRFASRATGWRLTMTFDDLSCFVDTDIVFNLEWR